MKVAMIGVGAMGLAMADHLVQAGHRVFAYDVNPTALAQARDRGVETALSAAQAANGTDLAIIMVATDSQVWDAVAGSQGVAAGNSPPPVVAVASTTHPETIRRLGTWGAEQSLAILDAPVVYGLDGARDGTLLTLVGGEEAILSQVRSAFMAYSRDVIWVGPLGAGEIAKMANNMLLWAFSVANYEVLSLVKTLGIPPERMRTVLLQAPASNRVLERWGGSYFTWAEKDMDVALDVAQQQRLPLPLAGLVDQLIKTFTHERILALMQQDAQ